MSGQIGIVILPTEPGQPPRAALAPVPPDDAFPSDGPAMVVVDAVEVVWSRDLGCWMGPSGSPAPTTLGDEITALARSAGVEW